MKIAASPGASEPGDPGESHTDQSLTGNDASKKFSIKRSSSFRRRKTSIYMGKHDEATDLILMARAREHGGNKWIIDPKSPLMGKWDTVVIGLLLFAACVTPFEVSFLNANSVDGLFIVNRMVDFGFLVDMFIQTCIKYEDEEGEWVCDRRRIVMRYIKSWFFVDLIAVFPFDGLTLALGDSVDGLRYLRVVRLLRLLKLLRLIRASTILERWQASISVSYATISLCRFVVMILFAAHWGACAWNLSEVVSFEGSVTWLEANEMENDPPHFRYQTCLYWSVTCIIAGTGPGDIPPENGTERTISMMLMVIGGGLYAYTIGSVCGILSSRDMATTLFQNSMDNVNMYMAEIGLPQDLRVKTRTFFHKSKHVHRAKFYHDVLNLMSPAVRGEITAYSNRTWIKYVPIFSRIPEDEAGLFLAEIALKLTTEVYAPQETLIRKGQFADKMFIIVKGIVAQLGKLFGKYRVVGDDMILHRSRRHYSAVALGFVDCYTLDSADLVCVLKGDFPATRRMFRRTAILLSLRRTIVAMANFMLSSPEWVRNRRKASSEMKRVAMLEATTRIYGKEIRASTLLRGGSVLDGGSPSESDVGGGGGGGGASERLSGGSSNRGGGGAGGGGGWGGGE